jgi:hypothetical protein
VKFHSEPLRVERRSEPRDVPLKVYGVTSDAAALAVTEHLIALSVARSEGLSVTEILTLENRGDRVIVRTEGTEPLVSAEPAAGAAEVKAVGDAAGERWNAATGRIELRGPVMPGLSRAAFTYGLPVSSWPATVSKVFAERAGRAAVLVADGGVRLDGPLAAPYVDYPVADEPAIARYDVMGAVEPGRRIELRVRPVAPPRGLPHWSYAALAMIFLAAAVLVAARRSDRQLTD